MSTKLDLSQFKVLSALDAGQRAKLAGALRMRQIAPGAVLFSQGDAADSCFFVLGGEILVDLDVAGRGAERVAVLERGDLFGEVALLDGRPRSASCTAGSSGAEVAALARADFDALFNAGDALAQRLMDIVLDRLVRRVRGATEQLLAVAAGE